MEPNIFELPMHLFFCRIGVGYKESVRSQPGQNFGFFVRALKHTQYEIISEGITVLFGGGSRCSDVIQMSHGKINPSQRDLNCDDSDSRTWAELKMVMRVAVLVNEVPPYRVALLEALAQQVDQLRIFVSTPREPDRPWATDWGSLDVVVQKTVTITRRRAHPQGYCQTMYVHVPYDTLTQLRRYKPDVIITGEMGARSIQAAIYRRFMPSTRLVVWCTLSETSEAGWSWARTKVRQLLVAAADGFVAGGQSGRRYLRRIGAPAAKIFIANQTVDISLFSSCQLARPEPAMRQLLYSGRFIGKKGLQAFQADAAQWAAAHPDKTVSIRWVGDGELRSDLEAFAGPSNFQQEFTGSVDYSELPRHYAECGILVLPTLDDEWGLVVNEAFASGLPVLGTIYSQAVEELVEEGETGWIYDPKQPGSAQDALDRLFETSDQDLYAMRERARARIGKLTPRTTAAIFRKVVDCVYKTRLARDERHGAISR